MGILIIIFSFVCLYFYIIVPVSTASKFFSLSSFSKISAFTFFLFSFLGLQLWSLLAWTPSSLSLSLSLQLSNPTTFSFRLLIKVLSVTFSLFTCCWILLLILMGLCDLQWGSLEWVFVGDLIGLHQLKIGFFWGNWLSCFSFFS